MGGAANPEIEAYIDALSDERRNLVETLRSTILDNLDDDFQEEFDFGMLVYSVPLQRYPNTHNGKPIMYAALASHKQYVSLYLMNVYADPVAEQWFTEEFAKSGRKLRMGKSCVRFRKMDDIPLELIGQAIARDTPESFIQTATRAREAAKQSRTR
jgi:hypothetical protein